MGNSGSLSGFLLITAPDRLHQNVQQVLLAFGNHVSLPVHQHQAGLIGLPVDQKIPHMLKLLHIRNVAETVKSDSQSLDRKSVV